jgi:hypothetical protein
MTLRSALPFYAAAVLNYLPVREPLMRSLEEIRAQLELLEPLLSERL